MKKLATFAAFLLLFATTAMAKDGKSFTQNARTVYHADGTYTESVQDVTVREQREVTYSTQKVVIAKKVYLLDPKGQPLQGNIYDGKDQLKARVQFLYDEFGRMSEERMFNLQGEVFQSITFAYDNNGKALPPKSRTFNVRAPDMKPGVIDFTNPGDAPSKIDRNQGTAPGTPQQGNVPYLPETAGRSSSGMAPIRPDAKGNYTPSESESADKKKGFFGRLFGGKKKDEKK